MKKLKIFLILAVAYLTVGYAERTIKDPEQEKWLHLYHNWYQMTQEQRNDRERMYELSPNKHLWFPEIHRPPSNVYTSKKKLR